MKDKKLKVLILGHIDIPLRGHALSLISEFPQDKYEVRAIMMEKFYGEDGFKYFYDIRKKWKRFLWHRSLGLIRKIRIWSYCGTKLLLRPNTDGYAFFVGDFNLISGKQILAKNPDFTPDLIVMMWTRTFVSSKAVRKMYELTKARFLFVFVDEAHLSGGCHYPVDCEGFMTGCHDCPAIVKGKKLAEKVMEDKIKYYEGIPKYVLGSPVDCRMAAKSPLFQGAKMYDFISNPTVEITGKQEARKAFGIPENVFVVMTGANNILEFRKGFKYVVKSINMLAEKYDNIYLLLLGNVTDGTIFSIHPKVQVVMSGFLDIHGLFRAFCASDCFLNMTIADSGAMMVNYCMACGTPIVSFYIGIAQDLVEHKETGYIARYKDSEDVACGIEYIMQLPMEARLQMFENCKGRIAKVMPKINWANDIYENWNR